MIYVTANGQSISLGRRLAAGGEGGIFEVPSNPKLVAKIYHKTPDVQKAVKLTSMVRLTSEAISRFAAWPVATLHEGAGQPLRGILMRRVDGARPIHELDTPAHRKLNYPNADW